MMNSGTLSDIISFVTHFGITRAESFSIHYQHLSKNSWFSPPILRCCTVYHSFSWTSISPAKFFLRSPSWLSSCFRPFTARVSLQLKFTTSSKAKSESPTNSEIPSSQLRKAQFSESRRQSIRSKDWSQ